MRNNRFSEPSSYALTQRFLGPLPDDEVAVLVGGVLGREVEAVGGGEPKLSDDCAVGSCKQAMIGMLQSLSNAWSTMCRDPQRGFS